MSSERGGWHKGRGFWTMTGKRYRVYEECPGERYRVYCAKEPGNWEAAIDLGEEPTLREACQRARRHMRGAPLDGAAPRIDTSHLRGRPIEEWRETLERAQP
jgi:crotonobetainyl-CoA:carnitine CoA-transferase CaiB-like acyl-CoA transferase